MEKKHREQNAHYQPYLEETVDVKGHRPLAISPQHEVSLIYLSIRIYIVTERLFLIYDQQILAFYLHFINFSKNMAIAYPQYNWLQNVLQQKKSSFLAYSSYFDEYTCMG